MKTKKNKIWLVLRLPLLPLDVFSVDSEKPIIITYKQQVVCATSKAIESGVKPYMPITTAQILTDCQVLERSFDLEKSAIHELANKLYEFTPYIEKQTPNPHTDSGLMIELSRSLNLFKGLDRIIAFIAQALQQTPFQAAWGIAHTPKAAWLLSFSNSEIQHESVISHNNTIKRLENINTQLLKQCPQKSIPPKKLATHIDALVKSGFNCLGDISKQINAQSLASFRKRWGADFTQLIADIFDVDQQILQPSLFEKPAKLFEPDEFFFDSIQFDYPIGNGEQLAQPMEQLLQNLSEYLQKRQLQCSDITWVLMDIYHNKQELNVHTSESGANKNQMSLLQDLTRIQIESQTLSFEVDTLELQCRNTSALCAANQDLNFNGDSHLKRDTLHNNFAITTAKLKARLGENALFKVACVDKHIPEQSHKKTDINTATTALAATNNLRPAWLFDTPHPIQQRQQYLFWRGRLILLQGPERIEGDWWHTSTARDYFIAERDDHLRLWVFYDLLKKSWFVQGVF